MPCSLLEAGLLACDACMQADGRPTTGHVTPHNQAGTRDSCRLALMSWLSYIACQQCRLQLQQNRHQLCKASARTCTSPTATGAALNTQAPPPPPPTAYWKGPCNPSQPAWQHQRLTRLKPAGHQSAACLTRASEGAACCLARSMRVSALMAGFLSFSRPSRAAQSLMAAKVRACIPQAYIIHDPEPQSTGRA